MSVSLGSSDALPASSSAPTPSFSLMPTSHLRARMAGVGLVPGNRDYMLHELTETWRYAREHAPELRVIRCSADLGLPPRRFAEGLLPSPNVGSGHAMRRAPAGEIGCEGGGPSASASCPVAPAVLAVGQGALLHCGGVVDGGPACGASTVLQEAAAGPREGSASSSSAAQLRRSATAAQPWPAASDPAPPVLLGDASLAEQTLRILRHPSNWRLYESLLLLEPAEPMMLLRTLQAGGLCLKEAQLRAVAEELSLPIMYRWRKT